MMVFKCLKCGKEVEKVIDRVRCPFCGYRIFSKKRPKTIKKVQAR
ncbi:MAG: DNA-directed RNA polymerase subunit P [Candidatus Aenigmarchaeota archaeon]|nr:DNA-directed RNA polymerase subunit P [Candidatus Aenigmarchaeota archaeon]